jgi:hypothetical protein
MVRDRTAVFVGSQSLRRPQIDGRREIGLIAPHSKIAAALARVFEQDWHDALPKVEAKSAKEPKTPEALVGVDA